MRSTALPGTARKLVIPTLERCSGKKAGVQFGFCVNPEFLREGTAIFDYDHPPKVVVGASDETSLYNMASIYGHLEAPFLQTTFEVAEAVKYTDNAWHAVKVNFGNEIGAICEKAGVDPQAVIDVFCRDEKLNISKAYLRPGLAFGGSCLPKDVRALNHFARSMDVDVPMLNAVLNANERQIQRALQKVETAGDGQIGVLGLSFKAGTDDLRESPMLRIVEELHAKGFKIRIYDPYVLVASARGANRDFINKLPHVHRMLCSDLQEFADHSRTLVIGNQSPLYRGLVKRIGRGRKIVDLVHLLPAARSKARAAAACA
jgi:GDP-mannose 6-dehydrogenase